VGEGEERGRVGGGGALHAVAPKRKEKEVIGEGAHDTRAVNSWRLGGALHGGCEHGATHSTNHALLGLRNSSPDHEQLMHF
jgi:hypothetical protein